MQTPGACIVNISVKVTFLLADTQIPKADSVEHSGGCSRLGLSPSPEHQESFLEDTSSLLNNGEARSLTELSRITSQRFCLTKAVHSTRPAEIGLRRREFPETEPAPWTFELPMDILNVWLLRDSSAFAF